MPADDRNSYAGARRSRDRDRAAATRSRTRAPPILAYVARKYRSGFGNRMVRIYAGGDHGPARVRPAAWVHPANSIPRPVSLPSAAAARAMLSRDANTCSPYRIGILLDFHRLAYMTDAKSPHLRRRTHPQRPSRSLCKVAEHTGTHMQLEWGFLSSQVSHALRVHLMPVAPVMAISSSSHQL